MLDEEIYLCYLYAMEYLKVIEAKEQIVVEQPQSVVPE